MSVGTGFSLMDRSPLIEERWNRDEIPGLTSLEPMKLSGERVGGGDHGD